MPTVKHLFKEFQQDRTSFLMSHVTDSIFFNHQLKVRQITKTVHSSTAIEHNVKTVVRKGDDNRLRKKTV